MAIDFNYHIMYPQDPPWEKFLFQHHFNLVCDPRVEVWKSALKRLVQPGEVVAEIGSGSGLLSILAAKLGAKVYAVEGDLKMVEYASWAAQQAGVGDKIIFICQNAREALDLPEKAGLLVAELFDTALIQEPQAPVILKNRDRILQPGGRLLPVKALTTVELAYCDYHFAGVYLPLPHFETTEVRKCEAILSQSLTYHEIDFRENYPLEVRARLALTQTQEGKVNSLKIQTQVELLPGLICPGSHWFNPPLILPLAELSGQAGDKYRLKLDYLLGEGLQTLHYSVER